MLRCRSLLFPFGKEIQRCYCNATRPPIPPFTEETARQKVQLAEDGWNSRNPEKVSLAYTEDCVWRNRETFLKGRKEIVQFLSSKWEREREYRLKKHYFLHSDDKIAVTYQYEYYNEEKKKWFRAYGNENWTFDKNGLMSNRNTSINDVEIEESERMLLPSSPSYQEDVEKLESGTFLK